MNDRIYLEQIRKYLIHMTNCPQKIILSNQHTRGINNIGTQYIVICDRYVDTMGMKWDDEYGILINGQPVEDDSVHVFLWDTSDEVNYDTNGCYVNVQGALNGILVIDNEVVTQEQVNIIQAFDIA